MKRLVLAVLAGASFSCFAGIDDGIVAEYPPALITHDFGEDISQEVYDFYELSLSGRSNIEGDCVSNPHDYAKAVYETSQIKVASYLLERKKYTLSRDVLELDNFAVVQKDGILFTCNNGEYELHESLYESPHKAFLIAEKFTE